jgi:hypothetical protein
MVTWWWETLKHFLSGAIGGVIGMAAIARFFGNWLMERVKAGHTKQLEELKNTLLQNQMRQQAMIANATYVTRAHFDTEFLAMKEVSQELAKVRLIFDKFHVVEAGQEMNETEHYKAAAELAEADRNFSAKLVEWGVFLTPEIYAEFEKCHFGSDAESRRVRSFPSDDRERVVNKGSFYTNYSSGCQMVRDRISKLAVLPGT